MSATAAAAATVAAAVFVTPTAASLPAESVVPAAHTTVPAAAIPRPRVSESPIGAPAGADQPAMMKAAVLGTTAPRTLATVLVPPLPAAPPPAPAVAPEAVAAGPGTKAAAAIAAAMSARGTPYRWGAAGKGGFDCSGLTLWAYRKAGVNLPHSSRGQSGIGTPVSRGDLRPGDLVFFYRPVSHVGIYVGDGKVLHAPQSGDVVKISPIGRMPFSGARRL